MFCAKPVCKIPRASIRTEDAINCIYTKKQVGKKLTRMHTHKEWGLFEERQKTSHFCPTTMLIDTLGNPAMKSLFRKYQDHILFVLAKKYIFTKHLESYKDYPKELLKNCLRCSLVVDKTTDFSSHFILNTAGVLYSHFFGCLRSNREVWNWVSLTHCLDVLSVQQRQTDRNAGHSLQTYHSFRKKKIKRKKSHSFC